MQSKTGVRTIARVLAAIAMACGLGWTAQAQAQSCAAGETPYAFGFTGSQQTLTVPPGVTQATVYLSGAQGGAGRSGAGTIGGSPNSPGGTGGLGGRVRGTLTVTPGDVLTIGVGGQASQAVNPGGIGQGVDGIGGGATDLRLGATRVGIAGGGGGGGNAGWSTANVIAGGAGGVGGGGTGGAGATVPGGPGPFGGGGGAVGSGGTAGGGCGSFPATPGSAGGAGGDSFNFSGSFSGAGFGGGGGGGATTGAGGGGAGVGTTACQQNWNGGGGGGAGGSSGATGLNSVTINNGVQAGNGAALICFEEPRFFVRGLGSSATGQVSLQLITPGGPETINVAAGAAGFAFASELPDGTAWSVSILAKPADQICTVLPASGVIANADANTLALTCNTVTVDITPASLPGGVFDVSYDQTLTATSGNGGTAPFTFSVTAGALPGGLALSPTGVLSGTPNALGSFNFTVQATSANGFTGTRAYTVVIAAPVISFTPTTVPDGTAGTAYGPVTFTAAGGQTPYGFAVTAGALPAGLTLTPTGELAGTPTVAGVFNFTITATDDNAFTVAQAYTLTIAPPTITMDPATVPNGTAGTAYGPVAFTAAGGQTPYTYAVTAGALPAGVTFINGQLSGTPTVAGTFNFTVTVTDDNAFTFARAYTLTIAPPTITLEPTTVPNGTAGTAYGPVAFTADGGQTPYTYAVTAGALPAGVTFINGQLSGTPTVAGTFNFTVTATDDNDFILAQDYTLTIGAPTITLDPITVPDGIAGTSYGPVAFSAAGGQAPYGYAVTAGALPAGVTFTNGQLSGTPTVAGSFNFTVTATDDNDFTLLQDYTLTIAAPVITVEPATLSNGTGGTAYGPVAFTADGGQAPYSFALTAGALPAGMTFTNGQLAGTPTVAGSFNFTIEARDDNDFTAVVDYALTIDAPTITVAPSSLPAGNVFDVYGPVAVSAVGGTAPYSFAVTSGALPAGLSLAGGQISGTPTASGSFNVTITATDTYGFTGQQAYTLVIDETLPEAQDHTLTLLAGTSGTVNLTQGAINGPFTNATIVTPAPAEAGQASIAQEGGAYILTFAAAGDYSGTTSLTYRLANSDGVSAPATVTITVTARPDPSLDPEVIGLIRAQTESTKRFANTQIRHFNQRLEQLHDEGEQRSNSIGVSMGMQTDPDGEADPDAYAVQHGLSTGDPALDAIQRVAPEAATNNGADTAQARQPLPTTATAYAEDKPGQQRQAPATGTSIQGTSGSAAADPIVSDSRFGQLAFWSGGYVNFGKNDDGGLKLDNTLVGVSAGADYRFSPELTAGLGFGYGRDVTDVGDNGTESRAEAISVAAYASYRPVPGFFLDGLAGYSSLDFDSERYVTGSGEFASGARDGDQIFGSLTAGYEYRSDGLLVSPYGRLSGSRSTLDGFTETGAGLDNLTFDEQDIDTLSGTLGLRVEKAIKMDWGVLTPRLRLEYTHDFEGSSRAAMGYADLGTLPYAFDVEAFSRDLISLGLGFDAQIGDGWNLALDYNTTLGTDGDSQDHTVGARLAIPF